MSSTETRSRDEWLAEVRRRGERIRRRRRWVGVAGGALALVLPLTAAATLQAGHQGHEVQVAAAGPTTTAELPTTVVTPTSTTSSTVEPPPPTTVEPRKPAAGLNGFLAPTSPASIPPADDPVVRSPSMTPATTVAPPGPATPCPASDVWITVVSEKASYASGEQVRVTSTLQNRSATACLVPTRAFFRIEDTAGRPVGSFARTTEFRLPVEAPPGATFTSAVTWDQKECSGSTCSQVPAGTYTAVAEWTEGGPYAGRGSFTIGR